MSLLDIALLAIFASAALILVFRPAARRSITALLGLGLILAVVRFAIEGHYWQTLPLYPLAALIAAALWFRLRGWLIRLVVLAMAGISIAVWAILPVPVLPGPAGPYAVGTVTRRWVDPARLEPATQAPGDRRNLVVQLWYPAAPGTTGPSAPYMDGLGRLPDRVNMLPGFVFSNFGKVRTHAVADAPISTARARWPVAILSPGYGAPRAAYTQIAVDLASRGYAVLALDHPYESAITRLADGSIATPIERFLPDDPDRIRYMEQRIETRVGDISAVIDALSTDRLGPIAAHLDSARVAAIGHSFGGASATLAMARDPRIATGADIDGMLYAGAEKASLHRPFLVIESDHAVTGQSADYHRKIAALLGRLNAPWQRHQIVGAGHLGFTDLDYYFMTPVRPLVRLVLGGPKPSRQIHAETVAILDRFLSEALPRDNPPAQKTARPAAH